MGITYIAGAVVGPSAEEGLDFLVDSGFQYTVLPEAVWRRIGLAANRRQQFGLINGTLLERDMANCLIRLPDLGETPTPVVLGESDDVALLGALTLLELGLVLNPYSRTLHPAALQTL